MKILIIDDSLLDRKLSMNMLKKSGVTQEILQAADGEEGLNVVGRNFREICLILLDWQMPKLNGIEFMKATRNVPEVAGIPIVMITASGSEENKRMARDVNPQLAGYLVKPYTPEQLMETIRPHLR